MLYCFFQQQQHNSYKIHNVFTPAQGKPVAAKCDVTLSSSLLWLWLWLCVVTTGAVSLQQWFEMRYAAVYWVDCWMSLAFCIHGNNYRLHDCVYVYLDTRVYCVCCYKHLLTFIHSIVFVHQLHVHAILLLRSIAHVSIVCVIHWHFCLLQLEISMNELLLVKVIYARYGAGKQHVRAL